MSDINANRNIRLGILAVQLNLATSESLSCAMTAWAADPSKSLGLILVEQGAIDEPTRLLLESILDKKGLTRHERPNVHESRRATVVRGEHPDCLRSGAGLEEREAFRAGFEVEGWRFVDHFSPPDQEAEVWRREVAGQVEWLELWVRRLPDEQPPSAAWYYAMWPEDPRLILA